MIICGRQPEELWTEVCDIVQEAEIKTIPRQKQCKKAKWLSEEALQIAIKRNEAKGFFSTQWRKGYSKGIQNTHLNASSKE